MTKKPTSLYEFVKRFPDDGACLDHLMFLRHGNPLTCPKCEKHGYFTRVTKRPVYQCNWCGFQISPMVGTPFENSHTPLQKWFYVMFLFTTTRHGVSAKEIQRQIGVTYKTAWRMGHEIRKYMAKVDGDPSIGGHVEIDETYIGGRRTRQERDRGNPSKTIVMGMLERGGDVMTHIVPNVRRGSLLPVIRHNVRRGSTISTDELSSYLTLGRYGYEHGTVNHTADEWRHDIHHTNSIEGFWSIFKKSIRSTHIHVSRKHLPNYLGEFEFRHNLRMYPELMLDRLLMAF